ncbi:hypothetical protein Stsp02_01470 [Streptomyces sp. NBRC 14336]|nr:hypothetical protein Stsp02_01470 [Streptomyces sp. NBRC 14336]
MPPVKQPPPKLPHPDPQRRNGPQPGHHNPPPPLPNTPVLGNPPPQIPHNKPVPIGILGPPPHVIVPDCLVGAAPRRRVQIPMPDPPPPHVNDLVSQRINSPERADPIPVPKRNVIQRRGGHQRHLTHIKPPTTNRHHPFPPEQFLPVHPTQRRPQHDPNRLRRLRHGMHDNKPPLHVEVLTRQCDQVPWNDLGGADGVRT